MRARAIMEFDFFLHSHSVSRYDIIIRSVFSPTIFGVFPLLKKSQLFTLAPHRKYFYV